MSRIFRPGSLPRAAQLAALLLLCSGTTTAGAGTCPEEAPLQNYTGAGTVVCPCFIVGEQAGAVLTAPAAHYPIEILRVGVGWGSQFGGAPQTLEQAINIYGAGLPDPGAPIATLPGPVMTDGFINEFDFEPLPGEITVNSGPFTVTIEFANTNSGDIFAPSVVHDGNGCQPGKNVVFAIPGGWSNACALGVTGDWVFHAVYRQVNCGTSVDEFVVSSVPLGSQPNPFQNSTRIRFALPNEEHVKLSVYDLTGREVKRLVSQGLGAGVQSADWDGTDAFGRPVATGTYFLRLEAGKRSETSRVTLVR